MKRKIKKVTIVLVIGLTNIIAYSQTDSTKVEYSQEKITKSNKMDEAVCDVLTRREKAEKDLWKFNLLGTFFGGFDISYERKLAPKWSLNIQSVTNYSKAIYQNNLANSFWAVNNEPEFGYKQDLNFQLRYYYNLNRRTRLGKKAGFSGNYFGLSLNNNYVYSRFKTDYQRPDLLATNKSFNNSLNIIYGIQRKIGKVGYIDVSFGLGGGFSNHYSPSVASGLSTLFFYSFHQKFGIGIAF